MKINKVDNIVNDMDWGANELQDFELSNYREYQLDLIKKHIGKNILEIGSGDRSFTNKIVKNVKKLNVLFQ